jgi:branched-chain amino acid transport system permease protein
MAAGPKDTSFQTETQSIGAYAVLKDLVGTAVITFLLLTPIVSFQTIMNQGTLVLGTRWSHTFTITVAVVVVRALMHLFVWQKAPNTSASAPVKAAATKGLDWRQPVEKYGKLVMLLIALLIPFIFMYVFPSWDRRGLGLAIYIMMYIMLGWGLNIVVGLAGLLDLGYVAFYAVGAYAYALLSTIYLPMWFGPGVVPWAFYIVLPLAGLLAALWGVILGFPVLRLRGDYLAIVTLAFGEIIRMVLINWGNFTNGPRGITVPKGTFFGLPFTDTPDGFAAFFGLPYNRLHFFIFLYYVILGLALITFFATNRLRRLPIGRAWEALREDEIACRSLGINTTNTKLTAFAIGAMFGGFAGSFFAARQGFVSPESFVYIESALILAIVVLGGLGSQIGIVFSAIAVMGSFEIFREMGGIGGGVQTLLLAALPDSIANAFYGVLATVFGGMFSLLPSPVRDSILGTDPIQYRMLAVGLAMVLMMRWKPRGFVTRRDPTVYLKEKKSVSADLVSQGHG